MVVSTEHIEKLDHFAKRFDLEPVLVHVACVADDRIIHLFLLFLLRLADLVSRVRKVKVGYRLPYDSRSLCETKALPFVDYSCWASEDISDGLFAMRNVRMDE